jgi:hypothetical protein
MRSKKVTQTVEAFNILERAQSEYEDLFNNLSEEEEAEFERRLFTQGVTINKSSISGKELKQDV